MNALLEFNWMQDLLTIRAQATNQAQSIRNRAAHLRDTQPARDTERMVALAHALDQVAQFCIQTVQNSDQVPHLEIQMRALNPLWLSPAETAPA